MSTLPEASEIPFKVLVRGSFLPSDIQVDWVPSGYPVAASLSKRIDAYWRREVEQSAKRDYVFNGDLCRLKSWLLTDGSLQLELQPTNYKQLLYSNYTSERAAGDRPDFLSRALGISSILVSADEKFILMRRSEQVGEGPGLLDLLGGHVEPCADARPDPFGAMRDELLEEINLRPEHMSCLGLIETTVTGKPEMAFLSTSKEDARTILVKATRHACNEVAELITLDNKYDFLESFFAAHASRFSPSAAGCLHLYLKYLEEMNVSE